MNPRLTSILTTLGAMAQREGGATMTRRLLDPILRGLGACKEARDWARRRGPTRAAYRVCPYGGWLIWLAREAGVDPVRIKAVGVGCARLAVDSMARPPREIVRAVEAAEVALAALRAGAPTAIDTALRQRMYELGCRYDKRRRGAPRMQPGAP